MSVLVQRNTCKRGGSEVVGRGGGGGMTGLALTWGQPTLKLVLAEQGLVIHHSAHISIHDRDRNFNDATVAKG